MDYRTMWECLEPGVKAKVEKIGGIFSYNGFVPCVFLDSFSENEKIREIDMAKIIKLADEDRYDEIEQYLELLVKCRPKKPSA